MIAVIVCKRCASLWMREESAFGPVGKPKRVERGDRIDGAVFDGLLPGCPSCADAIEAFQIGMTTR